MQTEQRQKTFTGVTVLEDVSQLKTEGMTKLVWREEGEVLSSGRFKFNEDHKGFEPLLVDENTKRLLLQVRDSLNEKNRKTFDERIVQSRAWLGKFAEIAWKHAKF